MARSSHKRSFEQRQIGVLRTRATTSRRRAQIQEITPPAVDAVDEMLIMQHGRELGYHLSDEAFKNYIEGIKTENKLNDADFKVALSQEGMTLDTFRENSEKQYIIQTVRQREILGHMSLTEEEARQYFDKHPEEFLKPATVMLREILVAVPAESAAGQQLFRASVDESAKAKIAAIRERAIGGEDFTKLVADVSESTTATAGWLVRSTSKMSTGIRELVDKLKVGDVAAGSAWAADTRSSSSNPTAAEPSCFRTCAIRSTRRSVRRVWIC
jgi:parvulin-like peptidyl-prolyl isomerase